MAPSIDNLYSGLMDELLPLDKPKRQDSILDMLKADVLGVILSEAGKPEKTEELLKAIAVKTSPDKAAAVEEAYRKHAKENADRQSKITKTSEQGSSPVTFDMDYYYTILFTQAHLTLQGMGTAVSVNEIGLNKDYFVVKGSADVGE